MTRDARRAQVLAVAQELFAYGGYHHVSMDDIARDAQVSKPILYRHFASKLELYLAVVDARGSSLLAAVSSALAPTVLDPVCPADGRTAVRALVQAYVEFVESAGESSTLLFESDVTHDGAARARVEQAGVEAARGITRILVECTGIPVAASSLLAAALVAMAQSGATSRLRTDTGLTVSAVVDLVARLAWGGVAGLVSADHDLT